MGSYVKGLAEEWGPPRSKPRRELCEATQSAGPGGTERCVGPSLRLARSGSGEGQATGRESIERHEHAMPKVGDEVTVVIGENNMVLEVHPQGTEGKHRFVVGEVLFIGKLQHEIPLKTAQGERKFQLDKQDLPASIQDGPRCERS